MSLRTRQYVEKIQHASRHWILFRQLSIKLLPEIHGGTGISIDVTSHSFRNSGTTTNTLNIPNIGAFNNRVLIISVGTETQSVNSVSLGANTCTLIYEAIRSYQHQSIWMLQNPPTGSQTISVVCSNAFSIDLSYVEFYNCGGVNFNNITHGAQTGTSIPTSITPTKTNSWILSFFGTNSSITSQPNTSLYNWTGGQFNAASYNSSPIIGSSNSMDWQVSNGNLYSAWVDFELLAYVPPAPTPSDVTTLTDQLSKTVIKKENDPINLSDYINKTIQQSVSDVTIFSENIEERVFSPGKVSGGGKSKSTKSISVPLWPDGDPIYEILAPKPIDDEQYKKLQEELLKILHDINELSKLSASKPVIKIPTVILSKKPRKVSIFENLKTLPKETDVEKKKKILLIKFEKIKNILQLIETVERIDGTSE